jgi:glycosyltransferase involved in cell wall biosynthesis
MEERMRINWETGTQDWAYSHFASHISKAMKGHSHTFNKAGTGDIEFLSAPDQLVSHVITPRTVLHLQGHRWYERNDRHTSMYLDLMKDCGAIIAANESLHEIAMKVNGNVHVVANGVDLKKWNPRSERNDGYVIRVGFCGNVQKQEYADYKGDPLVVEACRRLGIALRCALYGEYQISYSKMKKDFYYDIDILVHPSDGEGCSNTLTEAVACGIPVVITERCGYHAENMIDMHNAVFVDKNLESIISAISRLSKPHTRRRIGKNARFFAELHHDIRSIAKCYDYIFNGLEDA